MSDPGGSYLHLNRDGLWPGFVRRDLDVGPRGELTLATLPRRVADRATAGALAALPAPEAADGILGEGIALADDGSLFWTDSRTGSIWRQDPCDGYRGRVPTSGDAGALARPRGLVVHPGRRALLVADTGHHRLLLFSLDDYSLAGSWGGPGSEPGRYDRPTGLAVAGDGAVYVIDRGNRRVQKLTAGGLPQPGFETATAGELVEPAALAVTPDQVLVLDIARRAILRFAPDGTALDALSLAIGEPAGLAAGDGAIYVGDNVRRRLYRVGAGGRLLGEARGFEGPVAGMALAGPKLWVHPGAAEPVELESDTAFVRQGLLWGGPFEVDGRPRAWHRLLAVGGPRPGGAGIHLFVHPERGGAPPPAPDPAEAAGPTGGLDPAAWRRIAPGEGDGLVGETSPRLWIALLLTGDGDVTPEVEQLRLAFDHTGYEAHLPVIYRVPEKVAPQADGDPELLRRFLALFESFFDDLEGEVSDLRHLFDPATAPAEWLDWLAGWLAFDLDEGWPEDAKRRLLATAFEAYAHRGTARGLAAALASRLGVRATVEEPHAQTDWWALASGEESAGPVGRLGFSTRLAPAHPQGAVAGTSATLDGSHLIHDEDFGEPLFTGTAYRFSVLVPRSQISAPETLLRVEELIEREKPAHTAYRICAIEPGVRIGVQSLVGVDTILGGGPPPVTRLGETAGPLALGGEPPGRLGESRVGESTRLATTGSDCEPERPPIDHTAEADRLRARKEESWAPSRP